MKNQLTAFSKVFKEEIGKFMPKFLEGVQK
ncbi:hypothetical protein SAMN04488559_11010 [Isobaculum melis]|uniref:Uncharacterized protein n=1 Tax=Isobaculum melis TaxID=142588 RepID=A0A1H9SYX7_9LACT|nr:hypothetical protein SAMN04488559_11010 [Isobaculum melis]